MKVKDLLLEVIKLIEKIWILIDIILFFFVDAHLETDQT